MYSVKASWFCYSECNSVGSCFNWFNFAASCKNLKLFSHLVKPMWTFHLSSKLLFLILKIFLLFFSFSSLLNEEFLFQLHDHRIIGNSNLLSLVLMSNPGSFFLIMVESLCYLVLIIWTSLHGHDHNYQFYYCRYHHLLSLYSSCTDIPKISLMFNDTSCFKLFFWYLLLVKLAKALLNLIFVSY